MARGINECYKMIVELAHIPLSEMC